ncbi:MAG: hypothetical protein RSF78_00885 [Bacteroidales bacterium]
MRATILIILLINTILVFGQRNIALTIHPETINGEEFLKVNIENNNPEEIVIFTYAEWDDSGTEFFVPPSSYLVFKGYDAEAEIKTQKVLLTEELLNFRSTRNFTVVKAGATNSVAYKLFDGENLGYRLFHESKKPNIDTIKAKLKMKFGYEGKVYFIESDSNIVIRAKRK